MGPARQRRVGIYARVSKADRDDPNSIPVQLADCRARAVDEGWEVVDHYVDEGISAWNPRRKRPDFERLITDVSEGRVDTILVREQERLLRQMGDAIRVQDLAKAGNLRLIASTMESDINFSRARDRDDFRKRASQAEFYSDFLGEKIRKTHQRKRERGEWKGGGTRPFGYRIVGPKPYRLEVDEAEAALIRQAATDFLGGRGLRGICREWNDAGVRTATGKLWTGPRLQQVLGSPHLAGLRDDGGPAGIPAVLDEETSRDVRTLLADPERKKYVTPPVRRHFLTGVIRCALCGTRMTAHPNYHGTRTYLCRKGYDGTGCGKTRIVADPVEELIAAKLMERREREPEVGTPVPSPDEREAVAELRALEARLEELARDFYADHVLSRPEYLAAKRELDAKVAAARDRIQSTAGAAHPAEWETKMPGAKELLATMRERTLTWGEFVDYPWFVEPLADKAHRLLEAIRIHPATKRGPVFEPERVEVVWR